MEPMLNIAIRAARLAGTIITRAIPRIDTLKFDKKADLDYVSEIDTQSEKVIIETLLDAYPDHAIMAEESGDMGDSDYLWIIDPLDGTLNFLHGYPQFCVSIALSVKRKLQQAVVYDPVRDELFTASRGRGALLNDRKIRVSNRKKLEHSLLATGFPVRAPDLIQSSIDSLKNVIMGGSDVRRGGAAALDLAYVACGRLDGFWESGLKPWDVAAGALLVSESGGIVCDNEASENYLYSSSIVTANPKLIRELIPLIKGN